MRKEKAAQELRAIAKLARVYARMDADTQKRFNQLVQGQQHRQCWEAIWGLICNFAMVIIRLVIRFFP